MPLIKICINILCKLNEFLYLCISKNEVYKCLEYYSYYFLVLALVT